MSEKYFPGKQKNEYKIGEPNLKSYDLAAVWMSICSSNIVFKIDIGENFRVRAGIAYLAQDKEISKGKNIKIETTFNITSQFTTSLQFL